MIVSRVLLTTHTGTAAAPSFLQSDVKVDEMKVGDERWKEKSERKKNQFR